MAASRLTDEEIALLLDEASRGVSIDTICADAHVSVRTFYRWKRKFGGLTPSGVRQLKALRQENNELRRLLAGLSARSADCLPPSADESGRGASGARLREMHGLSVGRFAAVRLAGG
ncbi:transposase [Hansschlegelia zhihuaiae]|uniref:Transposase n=1 Tax=Hansschlegelia zhihuaiae TaxID=405005 RepID=A0A4Q0MPR6_9HYPH|nr:transposase [Hansschlegelia zhihuaiae]RXF75159.1 hypothetical protein EK403_03710 [Hansschlegelia zhihuaiae]